jgi:hypothetical protein
MPTWAVAAALMLVTWVVLAGLPGSPVRGMNRIILGVGSIVIIVGYLLLSQGPANNPLSLTWAPIVLVVGYLVLLPIALLRRQAPGSTERETEEPARTQEKRPTSTRPAGRR